MAASDCNRAGSKLFVKDRKPWCMPDEVPVETVIEIVKRCPAGALWYKRKDGGPEEASPPRNTIHVAYNGPLYASGDLKITGAKPDMPGVRCRAALCRCGRSAVKPFCDDKHEETLFDDSGAVGDAGPGLQAEGGPLTIVPQQNGNLAVDGNLTIVSGAGREAWRGTKTELCRCGQSKDKPFCDFSHVEAGFEAE
jgi:CDGSH-type Zn-finger protein